MPPAPQPQDPPETNGRNKTSETSKPIPTPVPASPAPAPTPVPTPVPAPQNAGQVDIDKILLPQKEVRKVESDRRVSAGILLDQEIKAGTEGLPKVAPVAPAPAAPPKKEQTTVQPLETYQRDIENVMHGGDVSVVSIAAAEAQRRSQQGRAAGGASLVETPEESGSFLKSFAMIAGGSILLGVAAAALAYLILRPTTVPVAISPTAPFISVDDTQVVSISSSDSAGTLMDKLVTAKANVSLSVGLIARIVPAVSSTTGALAALDAQSFLSTLVPHIPATLLRTIEPTYVLGVHVYDENQPFLLFKVDSYEEGFSGMLAWESSLKSDLYPLFNYTPSPRISTGNLPVNLPVASTTASTSSSSPSLPPLPKPPVFIDKIVENHDARVLQNDAGDIYLLWTFLDRNTLVITTNAATLREIISRFQDAPVTPVPTQ